MENYSDESFVKYYGSFFNPDNKTIYICIENSKITFEDIRKICLTENEMVKCLQTFLNSAFESLNFLHNKGIIHRSVELKSFIINYEGQVKLANFNECSLQEKAETFVGNPLYTAPEVHVDFLYKFYRSKIDSWSLGICLIELCNCLLFLTGTFLNI